MHGMLYTARALRFLILSGAFSIQSTLFRHSTVYTVRQTEEKKCMSLSIFAGRDSKQSKA